jgi:hypothetical protein
MKTAITNRAVTLAGAAFLVAQCVSSFGCSSSGASKAGTGGTGVSTGTGGSAGGTSGGGGSTGNGVCDKGGGVAAVGDQCVGVSNKAPCNMDGVLNTADDAACWNTCGPNKSGVKNCTCAGGTWACPTCDYDVTNPRAYDCYKTAGSVACPPDPSDTSGNMLPASGGACTANACKPCGSAAANSYRDSTGTPKAGWCICVPKTDGTAGGVYSCASVKEWAPQCP